MQAAMPALTTATAATAVTAAFARLRGDLRVSEQRLRGASVHVIGTPEGARFFSFGELEYFVLCQLDGASSPEQICQRAQVRFGRALPAPVFEKFLNHASAIGLLQGQGGPRASERGQIRGEALYLRLKALDPDRLLQWLLPRLRWCFSPGCVVTGGLAMLLALGLLVFSVAELEQEITGLYNLPSLAYAWLILLVTMAGHEVAHGLTCKHFGGQVREMGVMLIYFQPAVYCNVNDAWLFPEKSQRLWVTAAGPFFDLLLCAGAMIVWRLTDADSALHFTALVVLASTLARSAFNFNPLIKLDAYYFLADWLDIHNLRARAFADLGGLWRGLWRGFWRALWGSRPGQLAGADAATPAPRSSARERRIFLVYGLLAGAYSVLLLGWVALWVGQYLVDHFRGLGFLILVGLLIMIFKQPLQRWMPSLAGGLRSTFDDTDPTARRRRRYLVPALAALFFLLPVAMTVSGGFSVLPLQNADIRPEEDGVIEAIYVKEGDYVETGALIARLSTRDRLATLAQLDADILEKQAKLKMLRQGARSEDLALLSQRLATAATREAEARRRYAEERHLHTARLAAADASGSRAAEQLKFAEEKFVQMRPLEISGAISPLELKEAQSDALVRRKTLEEAQATLQYVRAQNQEERRQDIALASATRMEVERELQLMRAGSRPEQIEAGEAEVASLEAKRANLRDQIQRAVMTAPHAGVITTPKLEQMVGQHVLKGGLIAKVHDLKTVTVEIAVPELDIADVRVGQAVRLKARAYPGHTFEGRVTGIAPSTQESDRPSGSKVVRVRTEIDNQGGLLKTDMTGLAKIEAQDRSLLAVLAHNLFATLRVEFWSWW